MCNKRQLHKTIPKTVCIGTIPTRVVGARRIVITLAPFYATFHLSKTLGR